MTEYEVGGNGVVPNEMSMGGCHIHSRWSLRSTSASAFSDRRCADCAMFQN